MKQISIVTMSLALLFGATACGTSGAPSTDPGTTAPTSATKAGSEAPAPAPEAYTPPAEPVPTAPGVAKFGQTFTYDDGTAVTVSAPLAGTSTDTATKPNIPITIYTVTITNGTKAPMEPSAFAKVNYGADGKPAEQVYDSAQGLAENFMNKILPGKKATVKMAFAYPATSKDVVFTIAPTFSHDDAIFAN